MRKFQFSEKLLSALERGGWFSERSVDVSEVAGKIRSMGYQVHPEAERVLSSFDGLSIPGNGVPPLQMDGVVASCSFEGDELPYIERLASTALCPVGRSGGMVYFVDETGRWVVLDDRWTVVYCLQGAEDAFMFALADELPRFERRVFQRGEVPDGYF